MDENNDPVENMDEQKINENEIAPIEMNPYAIADDDVDELDINESRDNTQNLLSEQGVVEVALYSPENSFRPGPSSPERYEEQDEYGYLPGVDDLPIFATKEAKKIDASNKSSENVIESLAEELRDMYERIKVMKEHFKNVQQEVEHTNALYVSKQAEIHTESHLTQLSIRALARGQNETKKVQIEMDMLQGQLNIAQNEIYKANEKLDEFKFKMKWNQEELEKWAIASKQKDDDSLSLEKYARADEQKIRELMLQQEQLTREMQAIMARLQAELTDTQAKQMELDRVAIEVSILSIITVHDYCNICTYV
jgi:hypothetical protein